MTLDPGGSRSFEQQVAEAMIQNLQGHQASMLNVVDQLAPRVATAIAISQRARDAFVVLYRRAGGARDRTVTLTMEAIEEILATAGSDQVLRALRGEKP